MSRSASLIRVRWPIMAWMYSRAGSWSGMGVSFHRQLRGSYAAAPARKSGRGRILFHEKAARPFGGAEAEEDMATRVRGSASLKVLFIGNSFTARNDLPGLIARLAAARGKTLEHRLISAGGASLRTHWNAGEALKTIRAGHHDHVVLQEQSTLPVKNATRMHENVRLFDEAIKAAGARALLYMTWARRNVPESQQAITDAYTNISLELGATVVPVGLAWQRFLGKHDQPVLHDKDQSHPTLAGSFLAACVFLAVLFGESPVGLGGEVDGLSEKELALLQKVAWQTCSSTARRDPRA